MDNHANLVQVATVRRWCVTGEAHARRVAARLSLGEVAQAAGVDAATIRKWETGTRTPRRDAALRYYAILDSLGRVAA